MITGLRGFLRENWTERNIRCFIKGFCLVNIIFFTYKIVVNGYNNAPLPEIEEVQIETVTPKREVTLTEYNFIITSRNIFGVSTSKKAKINTLPLRLVGTCPTSKCRSINGKKLNFAIIEDLRNTQQDVFDCKDDVFDVGQLVEIEDEFIEVLNNGIIYKIYKQEKPTEEQEEIRSIEEEIENTVDNKKRNKGIKEVKFRHFEIKRRAFQDAKDSIDHHLNTGHHKVVSDGILVYGLDNNSIFKQLGITDNDIITKVNGRPVNSLQGAIEIYEQFYDKDAKEIDTIVITIKRAGLEIPIRYSLVE